LKPGPLPNPEGALKLRLRVEGGKVAGVDVSSTRPDVARALFGGRSRPEVAAIVPRLFSVCAQSQAAASALACAAAAGEAPSGDTLARLRAAVASETLRETAWRTLLDWPRALGEAPDAASIAAARGAAAPRAQEHGAHARIADAVFGIDAGDFLAIDDLAALDRWADRGATAAARHVRRSRDDDVGSAVADVPLLHARLEPWDALARAAGTDPRFAREPTWQGAPAETGALARLHDDPLVRAVLARHPSRAPARVVARLRELARLLADPDHAPVAGARSLADGHGLAWVENARGLLVHIVRLAGERVEGYAIVAPTEWNFHPAGVLARALAGTPAGDPDVLRQRAGRLVNSLDPCAACEVTVDDA
jgi:hypothetical protein